MIVATFMQLHETRCRVTLSFTLVIYIYLYVYTSVRIDYRIHITHTLYAVCEVCSVFAIHYRYIVEVFGKIIRRTEMIESSFKRKINRACYRQCQKLARESTFAVFYTFKLERMHDNSKTQLLRYSKKVKLYQKPKSLAVWVGET